MSLTSYTVTLRLATPHMALICPATISPMSSVGPTMRRRQLGIELRKFREQAGVSAIEAAHELDCSEARIRHLEGGRNIPRKPELVVLATLYRMPPDTHAVLEEIRQGGARPGWWSTYRLPRWLQTYVGAENDARTVRNFEEELIPGLLQTEAYARAVHDAAGATEIDRKIAARAKRQERLIFFCDNPLWLIAVISEAAFRRVADTDCAEEQFRHLIAMSERPNVTIRVLPFSAQLHGSLSGGFALLEFDPEISQPAGYFEDSVGGQFVDDPRVVRTLTDRFTALYDQALPEKDSVIFMRKWVPEK